MSNYSEGSDLPRVIPTPSVISVDLRSFPKNERLNASDLAMLEGLKKQLMETGVIERPAMEREPQTQEELDAMVAEAIALAKSEKELNPDFYDPSVEEVLGEDLSFEEDWNNPSFDGVDDYGRQVYQNATAEKTEVTRDTSYSSLKEE